MKRVLCKITAVLTTIILVAGSAALPVSAASSIEMVSIAAGQNYSLFVDGSGGLCTFGRNFNYTRGGQGNSTYPTPTKLMSGVKMVSAGSGHNLTVTKSGYGAPSPMVP